MESVVEISKEVLKRLVAMGYEKNETFSTGQLIFPSKSGVKRISEQELRQLFIEVFKKEKSYYLYSIETPTENRYSFTNKDGLIKIADDDEGQAALLDMCVFTKKNKESSYTRLLNIEFKHKNATKDNISKDILKLMHEKENGAFIILLKNSDNGTLINKGGTGIIDKLIESKKYHNKKPTKWNDGDKKYIELVILSLEEKEKKTELPFILHRTISINDLNTLDNSLDKWKKEILVNGVYKCVD